MAAPPSARNAIIVIGRNLPNVLPPEHISSVVNAYGTKADSLFRVPSFWTPTFAALPVELYETWKRSPSNSVSSVEIGVQDVLSHTIDCIRENGFTQVIVRSSAIEEGLDDRGRYLSRLCSSSSLNGVISAINEIYHDFRNKAGESARLGLVIQGFVDAASAGHLSNEVHLTPTRNQWKYELEKPIYSPARGINSKFATLPDALRPLLRSPSEPVHFLLRKVGRWINENFAGRSHIEWCTSSTHLWLLQVDSEVPTSSGADPRAMPTYSGNDTSAVSTSVLRLYRPGDRVRWQKLENVNDFWTGHDAPKHKLYYATAGKLKSILESGQGAEHLEDEIREVTSDRGVVRIDKIPAAFLLPRTHTVDAEHAVQWILKEITTFEREGANLNDICFIIHAFIPARVAAWTYFHPGDDIVQVDCLWGLPDGLQFLPHDSFQANAGSSSVISERVRYKPQFLQEQPDGSWQYVPVARQFGRLRALSKKAVSYLAKQTVSIAGKLNSDAQVMWFCDIPSELGLGDHLPWYRSKEIPEWTADKRPPFRTANIVNREDLENIELPQSRNVILRIMPEANLLRDETFLDEVVEFARTNCLPIELAGSVLCHAYYKLRSAGLTVFAAEPYAAHYRVRGRKVFRKLVRDRIPKKITSGGEKVVEARIAEKDIPIALITKLIEEGLEFAREKEPGPKLEELADIYEVLLGLIKVTGSSIDTISALAEKKRISRGGFEDGVALLETFLPMPVPTGKLTRGGEISLNELSQPEVYRNSAVIPLSYLTSSPEMAMSFQLEWGELRAAVRLCLESGGIRLVVSKPRTQSGADVSQLTLNFDW
jgi:predicted house-cleaning noncanonical NTP pyrophosphatase (MazG superfamily)